MLTILTRTVAAVALAVGLIVLPTVVVSQTATPHVDVDVVELSRCITVKSRELGHTPPLSRDVDFEVVEATGVIRVIGTVEQKAASRKRFADVLPLCQPKGSESAKK